MEHSIAVLIKSESPKHLLHHFSALSNKAPIGVNSFSPEQAVGTELAACSRYFHGGPSEGLRLVFLMPILYFLFKAKFQLFIALLLQGLIL